MISLKKYIDYYSYRAELDVDSDIYIARCAEFESISAHGTSHEDAIREIKLTVINAIEWMERNGERIPEPFGFSKDNEKFLL